MKKSKKKDKVKLSTKEYLSSKITLFKDYWKKFIAKKILLIPSVIFLILLIILSGSLVYLYSIQPAKTLEYNVTLFRTFENIKYLSFDSDYSGEVKLETGISRIDDTTTSPTSTDGTKLNKVYHFDQGNIFEKIYHEGDSINESDYGDAISKKDLANSDILFLVFSDESVWNDTLANKKYSVSEFTRDNDKFWRFTVNRDVANKLFMDNFKQSIIDGYNDGAAEKISPDAITTTFDGNVKITIDINQKTKDLSKVEFGVDKDMYFNFNDSISSNFASLYAQQGEAIKLRFVLKSGYTQSSTITKITYNNLDSKYSKFSQVEQLSLKI